MPIYDYGCSCGHRFEALLSRPGSADPACPNCGGVPSRRPARFAVGGRADPGPAAADAPHSWQGTHGGDRDYVTHWRRQLDRRAALEERHPELASERRPVLSHEGPAGPQYAHPHPHPHPPAAPPG